jgi:ubiquinol-cytochrome c reductase cytochrome c1 subunit
MMGRFGLFLAAVGLMLAGATSAPAAVESPPLRKAELAHMNPFASYDLAAVQRGFQVYNEVCAACHSVQYLYYRNLGEIGLSEAEVKAIAAEATVMNEEANEDGEMFERPGKPSDRIVKPFENDAAARAANGGALPPDLSLMVKARKGHEDYVFSLLTGYADPPADLEIREGMSHNPYFSGGMIAMAPPLSEDAVEYADGTKATVDQMARDVVTFLAWASEPTLVERRQMGTKVIIFLVIFSALMYAVKRKVWADVH